MTTIHLPWPPRPLWQNARTHWNANARAAKATTKGLRGLYRQNHAILMHRER